MRDTTKKLTLTAMFIALSVVFLYIAALIPSGRIAIIAVAGMITAAAVIECKIISGVLCFIGALLLSALIVPLKSIVFLYGVFWGYYPIIKALAEKTDKRYIEFLVKLLVFNLALSAALAAYYYGFVSGVETVKASIPLLYIGGNVIFILYDFGLSRLIGIYINRIKRRK